MALEFFDTLHLLGSSIGRGPISRRPTTVFELKSGHGSVLAQFRAKPGRWVLTIETGQFRCADCGDCTSRYLQFMALEDGTSLIGECVSNQFLDDYHRFTPDQLDTLRALGWNAPSPPDDPNWFFEVRSDAELVVLDDMTHRTLKEIFALHDRDVVEITFYEMAVGIPELSLPVKG